MVAPVLRRSRRRDSGRLAAAAARYARLGWPLCLGAYSPGPAAGRACSCDRVGCPAPAAHPMSAAWQLLASCEPGTVRQRWAGHPEANIVLPTGRVFDVLDVPASAGTAALDALQQAAVPTGPVAAGAGRALFFVATRGAPDDEDEWWSCHLDCAPEDVGEVAALRWHCRDSFVLAPPSRDQFGTPARWLIPPPPDGPGLLPDALRLLEFLADACEEEAV
ncbi:MAG: bifunctional DNA primase/polymerase [Streptosporangiaceae bacterium]